MKYDLLVERLMQHFTSAPYSAEVKDAKANFFELAGIFDEEAPQFELKMAQFMEWYLFSRKMKGSGKTPMQMALAGDSFEMPEELEPYYRNLSDHRHSLFEYLKLKGTDLHVKDLFSGYKYVIRKSEVTYGFSKDEYFEARLIPHEDNLVFSKSFCFHPPQAGKFILKEVKRIQKIKDEEERIEERETFILKLFKMRYKHEQYQHVDLGDIYSHQSRLRI